MEKDLISVQTNVFENPVIKLGNEIINLKDDSGFEFKTNDLPSFLRYVKKATDKILIYRADRVSCVDKVPDYNSITSAECTLERSQKLRILSNQNDRTMNLEEAESFFKSMRSVMEEKNSSFHKTLRNIKLNKVAKVESSKSNNGDFAYIFSMQSTDKKPGGKDEFEPPEKIKFTLPVFKFAPHEIELEFDFIFDYKFIGEECRMSFSIENLDIDEIIEVRSREIMEDLLKDCELEKYWGACSLVKQTDLWEYYKNELKIHGE